MEGYGLTETSPAICFNRPESFRFGSVGQPIPGVEVKIAADGEILARGENIMLGYLNKEEETKEVIEADGWFHTGDIGYLNEADYLIITDRKKNILVTSGGKNIAPQPIENNIQASKYVEQALLIGDRRKYCTAVIVPAEESIKNWADSNNTKYKNYQDLCKSPELYRLLAQEIDSRTANFAGYEKVKNFVVISDPFTLEKGELTPTLKIKRNVVVEKYADEIDKLYGKE